MNGIIKNTTDRVKAGQSVDILFETDTLFFIRVGSVGFPMLKENVEVQSDTDQEF